MRIYLSIIFAFICLSSFSQSSNTELNYAIKEFKQRNYAKSESLLVELIKDSLVLKPLNFDLAKYNLSRALLHQGKSDPAFDILVDLKSSLDARNDDSLNIEVTYSLASMYEFKSQFDSMEVILHKTLNKFDLDPKMSSNIFTLIGRSKSHKLQNDSAMIYLKKAIEIDLRSTDSSSLPYNYLDLGQQYRLQNQADSAVFYCLEGMKYLRPGKDDFKIPSFYQRIAKAFIQSRNQIKAEEYTVLSLEKSRELKLKVSEEKALTLMGELYRFRDDFETAMKYYYQADSLNKISNKFERRAIISRGLTECFTALGLPADPIYISNIEEYIEYTQSETQKIDCELVLLNARLDKLSDNVILNKISELENSEAVKTNLSYQKKLLLLKYDFQVRNQFWENAIGTSKELRVILDSLNREKTIILTHDLVAKYKKKEQDKEIAFLDSENEIKSELLQSKNRALWAIGIGLGLISILSFFLFGLYKKVTDQKEVISISLKEKDTLLKEIHHRVKNNLQVVSSLLRLQSNSTTDESAIAALNEGQDRVRSMSLIHQNLYSKDNLSGINMKGYLEELSANLLATYNTHQNVSLRTEIEDLKLDVDTVVPLGLIINELITNSLKYAFPNNTKGEILIILKTVSNKLHLMVKDDGIGIQDTSRIDSGESFGFGLINAFSSKLDADISIDGKMGTEVELVIKDFKVI